MEYTVKAPCNSWACKGEVQTFQREQWHVPVMRFGPRSGPSSGPLERAYCTVCGAYFHIPKEEEEPAQEYIGYRPYPGEVREVFEGALQDVRRRNAQEEEGAD